MDTVNLKVENLEGNEIIIREGDAMPERVPVKIKLDGDINTVSNFLKYRNDSKGIGFQDVDKNQAVVIVDKGKMTIQLLLDPQESLGAEITAKLEHSDELKQFCINTTKQFSREELIKLLKFSKIFFSDPEQHDKLLKAYQSFNAKVYLEAQKSNDDRGNRAQNFTKTVKTDLPEFFSLNLPIFKGQGKKKFQVEICLDVTEGGAHFWLESVELHNMIEGTKDEIFAEQLKSCDGFVIINK